MTRPPADFPHFRDGSPNQAHGAPHFELEIKLPVVVAHVLKALGHGRSGVVHQDVDPTIPLDRGVDDAGGGIPVRYVSGQGQDLALGGGPDLISRRVQYVLATRYDDNVRPLSRHTLGGRFPNTFAAARNNCYLTIQSQFHRSPPFKNPDYVTGSGRKFVDKRRQL